MRLNQYLQRHPHRRRCRARRPRDGATAARRRCRAAATACRCSRPISRWWIVANRSGGFFKVVSPSYFSTLGIKMIKGRALSDRDTWNAPRALVMNERLAKRYFEKDDPIGQRILIQEIIPGKTELGPDVSWEVVGVIGDEKIGGPADDRSAGVYVSNEQSPVYGMVLNVRTDVDPLTLQIADHRRDPRRQQGSGDHRHPHARADQEPQHGRPARSVGAARRVRRRGADPRRHRHLRRDFVLGRAAHARDRHSRRARRVASACCCGWCSIAACC